MKTFNKLFITAIVASFLVSCNDENDGGATNEDGMSKDVVFSFDISEGVSSKTLIENSEYNATFVEGDEVGVFVNDASTFNNIKYSSDGTLWNGGPVKVGEKEINTYYAYYPYSDGCTLDNIPVLVSQNQESDGYLSGDYLFKSMRAEAGMTNVKITMNHALALVEVVLKGTAASDAATIIMPDVIIDGKINLYSGELSLGETRSQLVMDNLGDMKYRAFIPGQAIVDGNELFSITSNGVTYPVEYKENIILNNGKYISLEVTIDEEVPLPKVEIVASGSINEWTKGDIADGSVNVEEDKNSRF